MAVISLKLGFNNYYVVDKIKRRGGLAVMWKDNVSCIIMDSSLNHINVSTFDHEPVSWKLTCFYDFPERFRRNAS